LENLETLDISVCYFKNSAQGFHLKKAGLISKEVIHCKDAQSDGNEILYSLVIFFLD
jgi:hypothetical protein